MLAKETSKPFNNKDWLFEIKWDGFRAIAHTGKEILLYSRNGNSFLHKYSTIADELAKIKNKYILDGEIVVLNNEGVPDFQKLQDYENNRNLPILYYVFDLLSINDEEIFSTPLIERKKLLKEIFLNGEIIRYSDHVIESGVDFYNVAIAKDLEGIMAKKSDGIYMPGERTSDWLKIKNHKTADVLIVGYTQPAGARKYFGSLVLGVKQGNEIVHVGNAGSGYNEKKLKEIFDLLQPLKTKETSFTDMPGLKNVVWVKPIIVCEVKFSEWTSDKKLRHPVFLRLRDDKNSKQINMKAIEPVKVSSTKKVSGKKIKNTEDDKGNLKFGKIEVNITNRSKIYFPDSGITKGEIIDYYQSVADYILPYLKDRPQSLNRTPNGIAQAGFFHKDAGENAPSWIKTFKVHSDSSNKEIDYIICNDKATLAYLNNLGCIELNPWHSVTKKPDYPDYMIIDLDPSDNNTFDQVIEIALQFKKLFDKLKINSYCKTSGASGLHIYIPMGRKYAYEQVKDFANIICEKIQSANPELTTLTRNLKKRGNKKMYLDYLQNRKSQTIASVYCVRPKTGATVSMPLLWKEVKPGLSPKDFTIKNALKRIEKKGDIFSGILGTGINMEKSLKVLST